MFKPILSVVLACLFLLVPSTDDLTAQETIGLGNVEYAADDIAVVSGFVDDDSLVNTTLLLESVGDFGDVQLSIVDIADDGSFLLFSSPQFIEGPISLLTGALLEPGTGESVGNMLVVANVPFDYWFDHWGQNPSGRVVPLPGRPCLYNYPNLIDNHNDIDMDFGDYFPRWPDADYSEEENLHYIEVLVEAGGPVKDIFVDDDDLPIDVNPDIDTTLDKEQKIIEEAGFEWDESIPGWRVPDDYIWNEDEKKWVPTQ